VERNALNTQGSLANRLLKVIVGAYLLIGLLLTAVAFVVQQQQHKTWLGVKTNEIYQQIHPILADALWSYEPAILKSIMAGLIGAAVVDGVRIEYPDGPVVQLGQVLDTPQTALIRSRFSVMYTRPKISQTVGYLTLYTNQNYIHEQLKMQFLPTVIISMVLTLALSVITYFAIRELLAKPLSELTHVINGVRIDSAHKQLSEKKLVGELATLQAVFNHTWMQMNQQFDVLQRFQAILESTPDMVFLLDTKHKITFVNESARLKLGLEDEPEIAYEFLDYLTPNAIEAFIQDVIPQATICGVWSTELTMLSHAEKVIPVSLEFIAHWSEQKISHFSVIARDISLHKAQEHEIRQLNVELENRVSQRTCELEKAKRDADLANQSKSLFLAAMSHEIRTPMNGVVGMVDLVWRTSLTFDQRKMIKTVRDSAFTLLHIIDDILDFSKIEAGRLQLESIPLNLRDVVEGVGDVLATKAIDSGVLLLTFVDPGLPKHVLGDQVRLSQILINLVSNAIKFTDNRPVGERLVYLEVRDCLSDHIVFSITDNGIGMSRESSEKLFKPFTQIDISTTRRYGGTGLGLSICHRLVELMGGTIKIESLPGIGSSFYVSVPLKEATELDQAESAKIAWDDLSGLHILLVSRLQMIAQFMRRYIEASGASVVVANAHDNLEVYWAQGFDVILLEPGIAESLGQQIRERMAHDVDFAKMRLVHYEPRSEHTLTQHNDGVSLGYDQLKRQSLIHGIAVAVGRQSPEQLNMPVERDAVLQVPSIEVAERAGVLVLLVEDNEVNQDVVCRQLNVLGYAVAVAGNGQEALACLQHRRFSLVLTDCHMPEMDGYELAECIRAQEMGGNTRLPIIAITANALKGEVNKCLSAGMDAYLSKPIEVAQLYEVMHQWLPHASSVPLTDTAEADVTPGAPIDLTALERYLGDSATFQAQFLQKYQQKTSVSLLEMRECLLHHQGDEIQSLAHQLKSSAKVVGAQALATLCEQLEQSNLEDWHQIEALVTALESEFVQVADFTEALRAS